MELFGQYGQKKDEPKREKYLKFFGIVLLFIATIVTFLTPLGALNAIRIQRAKVTDRMCCYGLCQEKATQFVYYEDSWGHSQHKLAFCEKHVFQAPDSFKSGTALPFYLSILFLPLFLYRFCLHDFCLAPEKLKVRGIITRIVVYIVLFALPWIFLQVY